MPTPKRHAPRGPLKPKKDPMGLQDPMGVQRCTAHSKQSGKPCRQAAIPGGTVCHYHGGAAPQVQQSAMERLRALQHPAIDRLNQLMGQQEFPTVAYQATRDILDRSLGKPGESLKVSVTLSLEDLVAGANGTE